MWRELSLFTGAGGGLYGSKLLGWSTVCAVEWSKYAQDVLRARQRDGWFEPFPIYDDVFEFDGTPWRGRVDVLSAGFPCQPFSVAGKELAGDDPRNGWPHTARIIREVGCPFVWLENVPGLISGSHGYFGTILGDLHALGFDAVWRVVSAAGCGAPHERKRLWIFAYKPNKLANHHRQRQLQSQRLEQDKRGRAGHGCEQMANANQKRFKECVASAIGSESRFAAWSVDPADVPHPDSDEHEGAPYEIRGEGCEVIRRTGPTKPLLGRVAHGVASRRDRLAALGNGQVPQQMVVAFRTLYNDAIGGL